MKATSVFGGMQVINIIIGLVRSKAVAYLIGPEGVGIRGLFESSIRFLIQTTSLGILTSGVKSVAEANAKSPEKAGAIVSVVKMLVWGTGVIGVALVCALSAWLSKVSFGNYDYTFSFVLLSVVLLLEQLANGEKVLLQGMRKIRHLAQATVYGAFASLLITVPIYYFWGIKGIVPNLILTSLSTLLLTWFFSRKIKVGKVEVAKKEKYKYSKQILGLGLSTSLSSVFNLGAMYLIQVFVRNRGGVEEVGLFVAGWVIVNTYVGMVFKAMGTDYLPRLASVNKDKKRFSEAINHQLEIALLIIAPIVAVFIIYIPFIINILYTSEFIHIQGLMRWAMLGMFFKAVSWSVGFSLAAKGDAKLLVVNSFISSAYMFGLNIAGYSLWGLDGLGISFLVGYMLHFIQIFSITYVKYHFRFKKNFYSLFSLTLLGALICFFLTLYCQTLVAYIVGTIVIVVISFFCLKELDKRLDIRGMLQSKLKK